MLIDLVTEKAQELGLTCARLPVHQDVRLMVDSACLTTKEPNSRAFAMRTNLKRENGRSGCPRPIGLPLTFLLDLNPDE